MNWHKAKVLDLTELWHLHLFWLSMQWKKSNNACRISCWFCLPCTQTTQEILILFLSKNTGCCYKKVILRWNCIDGICVLLLCLCQDFDMDELPPPPESWVVPVRVDNSDTYPTALALPEPVRSPLPPRSSPLPSQTHPRSVRPMSNRQSWTSLDGRLEVNKSPCTTNSLRPNGPWATQSTRIRHMITCYPYHKSSQTSALDL